MKTKLLFYVLLLIGAILTAQNTTIPDPNFEQALIDLGYDSGTPDGTVPTSNIENVQDLFISDKDITELTGIADFRELQRLTAERNQIASIDFTQNRQLTHIYLGENKLNGFELPPSSNLVSLALLGNNLSTIDVSGFPNLENLSLSENNISVLDIRGNPQLQRLDCVSCPLSNIDLTGTLRLVDINLWKCNLSSIDVTGLPDLVGLELSENNLSSLDITNNPKLRTIGVASNRISDLNLSSQTELTSFNANGSDIVSLDLSRNPNLTQVWVFNMPFLNELNVKNGNNSAIIQFPANNTPNLDCIQIDDPAFAINNTNWSKNSGAQYSTDCSQIQPSDGVTPIPDPNFEQALIDMGYDTGVPDGMVPTDNISGVTEIQLVDLGISSVAGLEDFAALEFFYSTKNPILELDISQNGHLKDINVFEAQLTELDVSQNTALNTIWLERMPNFKTIDLSNNIDLWGLDLNNTGLSNIDLSNNPNITHLFLHDTQLQALDVSHLTDLVFLFAQNNPNLSCISINDLNVIGGPDNWKKDESTSYSEDCPGIQPAGDVTQIPDPNFEQALIDLGYDSGAPDGSVPTAAIDTVRSLNLIGHFPSDLTGIGDFKAMDALVYAGSVLPSLDLSKNNKLRFLSISNNQMTSLILPEDNESGIRMFLDNNSLTRLEVSGLNGTNQLFLSGNDVSELDLGTAQFSTIDVSGNPIDNLNLENTNELIILLANNTEISILDVSNQSNLQQAQARNANLSSVDLKNGVNTMLDSDLWGSPLLGNPVDFSGNPNLSCIQVDDAIFAEENDDWVKDTSANYSEDCSGTQPDGEMTQIPDAVFEAFLIAEGYDSGKVDGVVPTANIDTVQRVSLDGPDIEFLTNDIIRSIEGISDFKELRFLESFRNEITELDLSENLNLLSVSVVENGSIDVLQLPASTEVIDLSRSGITTLDTGNLPNLEELSVPQTGIRNLDLSLNPQLRYLSADENGINSLNISKNQKLEILSITTAELETLDLSDHPNLRVVDLFLATISSINLKNGNNRNMRVSASPINAECIQVDDVNYVLSTLDWEIDPSVTITIADCGLNPSIVDSDEDGVVDADDICPDTPTGSKVTGNGCALSQLADLVVQNIDLAIGSEPCSEEPSGYATIQVLKDVDLNITFMKDATETIFEGALTSANALSLENLEGGQYQICVEIPNFPTASQCFEVDYSSELNTVRTKITVQNPGQSYTISVAGSTIYQVQVNNGDLIDYAFNSSDEHSIEIPLEVGVNTIEIAGRIDCSEINTNTEETTESLETTSKVANYPNPTSSSFVLTGLGESKTARVVLRNTAGSTVLDEIATIYQGKIEMNIGALTAGLYFLSATTIKGVKTVKVVKQ